MAVPCAVLLVGLLGVPDGTVVAQAPARPRILLTNDDGIRAPGLLALAEALRPLGEVTIVAPAENQSGTGHSVTLADPIFVDDVMLDGGWTAVAVGATPASAVKLALGTLLERPPDLVVSGINRGNNHGRVAYISGTVGAAREAAMQGIPAIAASLARQGHPQYEAGAAAVARLATQVIARGLPPGVLLNVNIPAGSASALKGVRVTSQSRAAGTERLVEQRSPYGRRFFWSVYQEPVDPTPGNDVWATAQGYIAVTPLRVGEFDPRTFEALRGWEIEAAPTEAPAAAPPVSIRPRD